MQRAETAESWTEVSPTPRRHGAFLSDKENVPLPREPRPSDGWLRNPAWIDGGVNPPCFYHSHAEIEEVCRNTYLQADDSDFAIENGNRTPLAASQVLPSAVSGEQISVSQDSAGHLVSVTMLVLVVERSSSSNGRGKLSSKKTKTIKSDHVRIETMSRVEFITAFLRVHDLDDQYSPGVHFGPAFRFWWTGSSGGKTGALTIENDHDFDVARTALLKKKKDSCVVNVEFDVDTMDGFRIRKRALPHGDTVTRQDEELLYGTKVPRVDSFSEESQIHGAIIMQLKNKWSCEKHLGEHGEPGHCYIASTGEHLGLNSRKLKLWAAAIAAADATKHEPPNTVDFDVLRDGRLDAVKPRGCTGPRSSLSSTGSQDATTMLLAAMIPLITERLAPPRVPEAVPLNLPVPSTPVRPCDASPFSPTPAAGTEIQTCLGDFLKAKGINILDSGSILFDLDLTPDIVGEVPVAHLSDVMDVVEGRVLKFQMFAREWNDRLQVKRRRLQ
ncbi:hypothetical protein DEU56DRAFT_914323 [Suillus clintonianus]|uniref:uncharacterized protein n=1 Tax=Suillus clintonianus TaxID=1904413 RepID=UPI001B87F5ED|nr:uncharacterized protein DEU56DRAFT_914323 [Suillus clintonianus]KAG2131759.1 hypothetical protein DEU56DRAFT_914323 [Suillus clintonianus]